MEESNEIIASPLSATDPSPRMEEEVPSPTFDQVVAPIRRSTREVKRPA